MSPEQREPNLIETNNIETEKETAELSIEQKKTLKNVWSEMIVDIEIPENIEDLNQESFKNMLYQKTREDVDNLADEWGLKPDQKLIESIQKTENAEDRAVLELEYIKKEHARIDEISPKFSGRPDKTTKWDSWPKLMRKNKQFNCVGATLLGMRQLEKGGIKSYYGNPYGHAVNIAKLSNGEWWYVDFRNDKERITKIEPEIIMLADTMVLKIDNPDLGYKLIPIYENSEVVASIIENLASMESEAENQDAIAIEKREAKEYIDKYEKNFKTTNFSALLRSLYLEKIKIDGTKEMQDEGSRIELIINFDKTLRLYLDSLPKEKTKNLMEEIKKQKESVKNLFKENDESIFENASPDLKKALDILLKNTEKIKEKLPAEYYKIIELVLDRIDKIN